MVLVANRARVGGCAVRVHIVGGTFERGLASALDLPAIVGSPMLLAGYHLSPKHWLARGLGFRILEGFDPEGPAFGPA